MKIKSPITLTVCATLLLAAAPACSLATSITTATSRVSQLTSYASPVGSYLESVTPDISRDGSSVVFMSTADLISGQNPNGINNLFAMGSDGASLTQLTSAAPVPGYYYDTSESTPRISAQGKVIVFSSPYDLTGENPAELIPSPYPEFPEYAYYRGNAQIFVINRDGSGLRQLTRGSSGNSLRPRISDDGRIIAFESDADLIPGQNSDHTGEIFVINADGSGLTQITNGAVRPAGRNIRGDESRNVSISGDGSTVAFDSFNDLLPPRNDDWSNEIFVFDLAGYRRASGTFNNLGQFTVQITDTDVDAPFHIRAEDSFEPSLSYDGTWVAFSACINPGGEGILDPNRTVLGDNPFLPDVIFMAKRDGSNLRQLTFSDDPNAYANDPNWRNIDDDAHWPEISADGTRIVFGTRSRVDLSPNANGSHLYEIAMIDLNAPLDSNGRPVVRQLTNTTRPAVLQLTFNGSDGARLRPSISADAKQIVLRTTSDFTGGNPDKNSEIFLVEPLTANLADTENDAPQPLDSTTPTATDNPASSPESSEAGGGGGGGALGSIDLLLALPALTTLLLRRWRRHI